MTNKKFKMAAMSLALTACVAASPLAANAEAPENTSDANSSAAVQHESEPETAAETPAAKDAEASAAPAAEPVVLPAQPLARPVVVTLPAEAPAEEAPAAEPEETPEETPAEPEAPAEEAPESQPDAAEPEQKQEEPAEDKPAEEPADDTDDQPQEEPAAEQPEEPAAAEEAPAAEDAAPAAQPAIQLPVLPTADIAVENPYGISTLLPGESSGIAVDVGMAVVNNDNSIIYGTLDDAIAAAKDGDTIFVDRDVTSDGIWMENRKLTIQGVNKTVTETDASGSTTEKTVKPKLTFRDGISLKNAELMLKNLDVDMTGRSSTPNPEQTWMGILIGTDSVLTLDHTDLVMDIAGCKPKPDSTDPAGIYMDPQGGSATLNIQHDSHLTINNYNNAIATNGATGNNGSALSNTYTINILDGSTFTADGNEAGIVGTKELQVNVDASEVHITNCVKRFGDDGRSATNGANFRITNGSVVETSGCAGGYGLHANNLYVEDSTIIANNNGYIGIRIDGKGEFINSHVTVKGTGINGKGTAGIQLNKVGTLDVTGGTMDVSDNNVTGIRCSSGTHLTIADDALVRVVGNESGSKAGGLRIFGNASARLGANTIINNNHAATAGDDIFIEEGGTLTFSVHNATGDGDILNDCTDGIDGWYIDAAGERWDFHGDQNFVQNLLNGDIQLVDNGDGTYTITVGTGGLALKAAHAELPTPEPEPTPGPVDPDPDPTPEPENNPVTPEDPTLPPVQDARVDETPETPVPPSDPVLPAVQDAHALPQTGTSLFAALAMALSGIALTAAGAWASLTGKRCRH